MSRIEELRTKVDQKVSEFSVGDIISFALYDDAHCTGSNGDAIDVDMEGKIISIGGNPGGHYAMVENKYGTFHVWLAIATKVCHR